MAVREKNPIPDAVGAEPSRQAPKWLRQLDEFGQKHARVIVTVSAGLIVLTVLLVANIVYRKTLAERVSRDIARAETVETLRELKQRYAGTEEAALIVVTLGNKLYDEGKFTEAKAEYEEFLQKFGQKDREHPLAPAVRAALASLEDNLKFEAEEKEALKQIPILDAHPLRYEALQEGVEKLRQEKEQLAKDPSRQAEVDAIAREIDRRQAVGIGPVKEPHPELVIRIKSKDGTPRKPLRVELFEDEAPNTVAAVVELAEKKYFDGMKLKRLGEDRLQVEPRTEGAVDYRIPFEVTGREADVGSLVMIRDGANNRPDQFQLLLKSVDSPGDVTICGVVAESDREAARQVAEEDIIDSVTVAKKRPHEYKATTVRP